MKILLEAISFIGLGIIITVIFSLIRNQIVNRTATTIKEKFETPKFLDGMFNLLSPVHWTKDLVSILNLRKITIYLIILGLFFGYGYWKGQQGIRPIIDLKGKEEFIKTNEHYLHINKDGTLEIVDKDKKTILKKITIKDVDSLRKALRPYSLEVKPIGIMGVGIGNKVKQEIGGGVSFIKYYDYNANVFITNEGAYLGISYKLRNFVKWLNNTSLLIGYGKGWQGDNRAIIGGRIEF